MKLYTKIHDEYYDLTSFDHPGGHVSISLASGRDATELFELHHQFSDKSLVSATLKKFKVSEDSSEVNIASNNVYDWDKTLSAPFTKELKAMAKRELGQGNMKATTARWVEYIMLLVLLFSQFYCVYAGYWFSLVTYPIALWMFVVNVFHDACHFAISRRWRLNALAANTGFMLATPYAWYHQHTIGHHSFPNIPGRDPDLYHVPDTIRNAPDVELSYMHHYQHYLFLLTSTFGIPMYFLVGGSLLCILGHPYNGVVPLSFTWSLNTISIPIRLLFFMIVMYISPIIFHGLSIKAATFAIIPEFIFTACFTICTQINHLVPEATEKFDSNFFVHQIITGHNINTGGYWTTLFTGGLNMQIEHHLFPSVNHCHLHKLVPHVKALCVKYNITYPESISLWEALGKHVNHMYNMGPAAFNCTDHVCVVDKAKDD